MTEDKEFTDNDGEKDEDSQTEGGEQENAVSSSTSEDEKAGQGGMNGVVTLDKERRNKDVDDDDDDEEKQSDEDRDETEEEEIKKNSDSENITDDEKKDDESEDEAVENNDEPVVVEGKRKRIQVERLSFSTPIANSPSRAPIIGSGIGKSLGSFPHIENNISKIHSLQLKLLHRLLYTYTSKMNLIKREVRLFNGFPFKPLSKDYQKKVDFLNRLNQTDLKVMKQVLGMKSRVKKELIEELLTFLCEPDEKKFQVAKKRHNTPKSAGEPKAKRSKASPKSSDSDESLDDANTDEEHEEKEQVIEKFKNRVKEKKKSPNTEVSPELKNNGKSALVKQRSTQKTETVRSKSNQKLDAEKIKPAEKGEAGKAKATPKAETGKSKTSNKPESAKKTETSKKKVSENPDSKNQTSKKKKNVCSDSNPTDEMIVNMIRELLKGADLTMISMRQMINTLHECFPNASFEGRKAFLKEKVILVVQE